MTEELKKQVSGEPEKDDGLPQPTISEKAPASPTSALTSEQILEALRPEIRKEVERGIQSTKDKRFSDLGKMKELLAQIKEGGGVIPPALEQQVQMQDMISQQLSERGVAPVSDKSMSSTGASQQDNFDFIAVIKSLGLDANNPEVLSLLRGTYKSTDHFEASAARLALRLSNPGTASETLSPAPTTGRTFTSPDVNALAVELEALQKKPRQNAPRIAEIENKLREAKAPGW